MDPEISHRWFALQWGGNFQHARQWIEITRVYIYIIIYYHSYYYDYALTQSFAQESNGHKMHIYLKITINTRWFASHDHICCDIDHAIRIKI